jgi:hypothetical protein
MASNSSAAAFFGVRDGDQQDQIKPLISPQQQQAAALPGVAGAPTAAAQPPPKKKRTMPGNSRNPSIPLSDSGRACTLHIQVRSLLPARDLARLDRLEFYELDAGSRSIFFSHMHSIGFSFHFFVVSSLLVCVFLIRDHCSLHCVINSPENCCLVFQHRSMCANYSLFFFCWKLDFMKILQ